MTAARVTGQTQFVADLNDRAFLHARCVRIPIPRARIRSITTAAAEQMPGVVGVFVANDLAINGSVPRFGPLVMDQPVLAMDETRYQGEPLAVVVADSPRSAAEASRKVDVAYDELTPVLTLSDALGASPIHHPSSRPPAQAQWADTNLMGEWTFSWGDLEEARQEASVVVDNTYSIPFAHHFAIETYAAVAMPDEEGVTVITPTQHPFILRDSLARMLGRPTGEVRVRAADMGGSFGSKGYPKIEPLLVLLALRLGKPVAMTLTAEESFLTGQREAAEIRALTGFDEQGRILFHDMQADFMVGAYTDISERVVSKTGLHALTAYRAQAARVTARGIFTNTPPTTAFRGFGAPHTVFALESQLNLGATELGLDPLTVRLANIRHKGESVPGEKEVDGDWASLLETVAAGIGWNDPRQDGQTKGIALGLKTCVPATESVARIHRRPDGVVTAFVGTTEMGQGTRGTLAELVAERLGLSADRVEVHPADTAVTPFDALTASSRSLVHMGNALVRACDDLDRQEGDSSRGSIGVGQFRGLSDPGHVLGGPTPFYEVVATGVELSVDVDTGMVTLGRVVHATDAGHVFDHKRAAGLDAGGLLMGMGLATSEQLILHPENGRLLNGSSLDYRIPTAWQLPPMSSSFLENHDGPGPAGAKGLAEGGIMAIAPAMAHAIWESTGVYLTRLPFTPERVWSAVNSKDLAHESNVDAAAGSSGRGRS